MPAMSQLLGLNLARVPVALVRLTDGTGLIRNARQVAVAVCAQTIGAGALSANILKSVYSATGRGQLNWLGAWINAPVGGGIGIRIRVVIDGAEVLNALPFNASNDGDGWIAVGGGVNAGDGVLQPLVYRQSIDIQVAATAASSSLVDVGINAEVHQ